MAAPARRVSMAQATAVAGTLVLVATLLVAVGPAAASPTARTSPTGYRLLAGDGGVFAFTSPFLGSAASDPTRCPTNPPGRTMPGGSCWSMAATMDGGGYYVLNAATGRIFTYGDAVSYGQPANTPPYQAGAEFAPNAVAIALTADGLGYWVLEEGLSGLGSVQAFGDAASLGDEVSAHVVHNGFPVGIVGSPDGKGYLIVDSDGGVFAFGDAVFAGSLGGTHLNAPVVGLAATRTATATGWRRPTAASSRSATPSMGAPWAASTCWHPSSPSPPIPPARVTGWRQRTAASSRWVERRSSGPWGAGRWPNPSSPSRPEPAPGHNERGTGPPAVP